MWYGMVCGGIVEVWCVVVWLRYGVWWLVSGGMVEVWCVVVGEWWYG